MAKGDIVHLVDEFASLPWGKLDLSRCGLDWTIGRGFFGEGVYHLVVHTEDRETDTWISSEYWELPTALGAIIAYLRDCSRRGGQDDIRQQIKKVIGVV